MALDPVSAVAGLALDCASRVKFALALDVRGMRLRGRCERAYVHGDSFTFKSGDPPSGTLCLVRSEQLASAACKCPAFVLNVYRMRNITEVINSVIGRLAVDMVDLSMGPHSVYIQVRKSMQFVSNAIDLNSTVRSGSCRDRHARWKLLATHLFHSEGPRVRIVIQHFLQPGRGNIAVSHDAPQMLIGQRPAAILSRLPASPFSHRNEYGA